MIVRAKENAKYPKPTASPYQSAASFGWCAETICFAHSVTVQTLGHVVVRYE
jgi:hypothetical protein